MKILFFQGGTERAGAERMLHYLVTHLDTARYQPVVAFMGEGPFVDEVRASGVEVISLPQAPRLRQVHRWAAATRAMETAISQTGADLVHANGEKMSIWAARAASRSGIPMIAWLHDAPGAGGVSGRLAQRRLAQSGADAVITCSAWLSDEFNRQLGMKASPIINGLDLSGLPEPTGTLDRLKADIGWQDRLVVGHFARLQRWKGTDVFIRAAARLRDQRIGFLVVGAAMFGREESFADELRKSVDRLGLSDTVHFTGYRPDALELMAEVDVVAHCSVQPDPFPTVVLEAMALGRPCIATRTRGPEEAIEDHVTGRLIPPKDDSSLAEAIRELAASPTLRQNMGEQARKVARERYSARRMAEQFQSLYDRLTQPKTPSEAR